MPPKCKSCVKLRNKIEKQDELIGQLREGLNPPEPVKCESCPKLKSDIERKDAFIEKQRVVIQEQLDKITEFEAKLEITTSIDLQPYFYKLDRISALVKTDDTNTFLEELDNFKTMLTHIRRENDTTA